MTRRMEGMKRAKLFGAAVLGLAAIAAPQAASASLVYDESIRITGTGFGNEPRLITVQERGPRRDGTESACTSAAGGNISFGASACLPDEQVFQGNGVTNTGGDEVNPMADNQKYGIPTLSETGWEDASDIGLIFNATEPQNDGGAVSLDDVTLKFYLGDELLAAIDGSHNFAEGTYAGNGVAGFTFVVDEEQQAYLNSTVFGLPNFGDVRIALETTLSGAAGGPESFWAYNLNRSSTGGSTSSGGTDVPAPGAIGLFALAAFGLVAGRSAGKKRNRAG